MTSISRRKRLFDKYQILNFIPHVGTYSFLLVLVALLVFPYWFFLASYPFISCGPKIVPSFLFLGDVFPPYISIQYFYKWLTSFALIVFAESIFLLIQAKHYVMEKIWLVPLLFLFAFCRNISGFFIVLCFMSQKQYLPFFLSTMLILMLFVPATNMSRIGKYDFSLVVSYTSIFESKHFKRFVLCYSALILLTPLSPYLFFILWFFVDILFYGVRSLASLI